MIHEIDKNNKVQQMIYDYEGYRFPACPDIQEIPASHSQPG